LYVISSFHKLTVRSGTVDFGNANGNPAGVKSVKRAGPTSERAGLGPGSVQNTVETVMSRTSPWAEKKKNPHVG